MVQPILAVVAGGGGFASRGVRGMEAAGGSGVVIVKEPAVDYLANTSGVWSLEAVYENVSAGTWT
jgi:hypothetical protein